MTATRRATAHDVTNLLARRGAGRTTLLDVQHALEDQGLTYPVAAMLSAVTSGRADRSGPWLLLRRLP